MSQVKQDAGTSAAGSSLKSASYDFNIESLRGYAALFVLFYHLFWLTKEIDPGYNNVNLFKYAPPGHTSVLVFFLLSGYVIGLSNKKPLLKSDILPYLRKRLVRLYPIYVVSILFTLLILSPDPPLGTIVANLTFLQVSFAPVIEGISPIWSLHYEMVFYLLFIPLSYFNINSLAAFIGCFILGVAMFFIPAVPTVVISLLFGFCFWVCGHLLARIPLQKLKVKANESQFISSLLLLLCIETINPIDDLLSRSISWTFGPGFFTYPSGLDFGERAIEFIDFALLPYCIFFLLVFAQKDFPYRKVVFAVLQLLPLPIFTYLLLSTERHGSLYLATLYYGLSIIAYFANNNILNRVSAKIMRLGIWLGGLSYGVYIIHKPIINFFIQTPAFSGSFLTFGLRFLAIIIGTLLLAYILEKKFQPGIKKLLS